MPPVKISADLANLDIRTLAREDLDEADRITRISFGTFLNLPDPSTMFGDRDVIRNRFEDTSAILAAYSDRRLLGLNVVTKCGSFGWFGPLVVRPELWDRGIAKRLMSSTMELFSKWGTTAEGLFTFADSPKHVGLYHRFGFFPRFLTLVMTNESCQTNEKFWTFASLSAKQRDDVLHDCVELTEGIYRGLDVTLEILSANRRQLGDTVLLMDEERVEGFAICHVGPRTEAGTDVCYIKFGAVPSNESSSEKFSKLVDACRGFAATKGAHKMEVGMNLGRTKAYEVLSKRGFKTLFQGVAMQRPNEAGYNRPEVFAMDDWR